MGPSGSGGGISQDESSPSSNSVGQYESSANLRFVITLAETYSSIDNESKGSRVIDKTLGSSNVLWAQVKGLPSAGGTAPLE